MTSDIRNCVFFYSFLVVKRIEGQISNFVLRGLLIGLFLGLSPIGINFTSITVSLSTIVLVFATVAFIRKSRELRELYVQSPE